MSKIFDVITKGIPNTSMVKWDQLSEQERWALVYTVVEFAGPKAPSEEKIKIPPLPPLLKGGGGD